MSLASPATCRCHLAERGTAQTPGDDKAVGTPGRTHYSSRPGRSPRPATPGLVPAGKEPMAAVGVTVAPTDPERKPPGVWCEQPRTRAAWQARGTAMQPAGLLWGGCRSRSWRNSELLPGTGDPGAGESLGEAISWLQRQMAAEGEHQRWAFSWKITKCLTQAIPWGKRAQPGPRRAAQRGGDGTAVGVTPTQDLVSAEGRLANHDSTVPAACSAPGTQDPTPGGVVSVPGRREKALGFAPCVTSPAGDSSVASPQHTGRRRPILPVPPAVPCVLRGRWWPPRRAALCLAPLWISPHVVSAGG